MRLISICRLFYNVYYVVAVKYKYTFGESTFSNKTKRGHQFFGISVTGRQRFCFGLMINLASPRPSINIEWSLMLKFFGRSEFFVIQWNPVNTVTDEPK